MQENGKNKYNFDNSGQISWNSYTFDAQMHTCYRISKKSETLQIVKMYSELASLLQGYDVFMPLNKLWEA